MAGTCRWSSKPQDYVQHDSSLACTSLPGVRLDVDAMSVRAGVLSSNSASIHSDEQTASQSLQSLPNNLALFLAGALAHFHAPKQLNVFRQSWICTASHVFGQPGVLKNFLHQKAYPVRRALHAIKQTMGSRGQVLCSLGRPGLCELMSLWSYTIPGNLKLEGEGVIPGTISAEMNISAGTGTPTPSSQDPVMHVQACEKSMRDQQASAACS